jgi:hypothetical protein
MLMDFDVDYSWFYIKCIKAQKGYKGKEEIGNWGNWKLEIGNWKLGKLGKLGKLEIGNWKLEIGNWGNWKLYLCPHLWTSLNTKAQRTQRNTEAWMYKTIKLPSSPSSYPLTTSNFL